MNFYSGPNQPGKFDEAPNPESENSNPPDLFSGAKGLVDMYGLLKDIQRVTGKSAVETQNTPNITAMEKEAAKELNSPEFHDMANQINGVVGFMESIPPEQQQTYMAMTYGVIDTLDSSIFMEAVRAVWDKIPGPVQSLIAVSPETSLVLGGFGPIIHFLVKAGLLPYNEETILKGEEIREKAVELSQYAGLLYKPLRIMSVLAQPIIRILRFQNDTFADVRSHLASRHNQNPNMMWN